MDICQVNLHQLVPPWSSSFTFSARQSSGTSGTGFIESRFYIPLNTK